jgi:hypothetical protein
MGWARGRSDIERAGEVITEESWPTMHDALVALMFMAVVMFPCFISVGRIE